jgi:hypothetical protein
MHWRAMIRLFGILLMLFSLSFLPSLGIALWYDDGQWNVFGISLLIAVAAGAVLWLLGARGLPDRDAVLGVLSLYGALPFLVGLHLDLTDAVFESMSGFTTTGATVISRPRPAAAVHALPPPADPVAGRHGHHRAGGGHPADAGRRRHAALPGGGSGVSKQDKLTPRIAETARAAVGDLPHADRAVRGRLLGGRHDACSTRSAMRSPPSPPAASRPTTPASATSTARSSSSSPSSSCWPAASISRSTSWPGEG